MSLVKKCETNHKNLFKAGQREIDGETIKYGSCQDCGHLIIVNENYELVKDMYVKISEEERQEKETYLNHLGRGE